MPLCEKKPPKWRRRNYTGRKRDFSKNHGIYSHLKRFPLRSGPIETHSNQKEPQLLLGDVFGRALFAFCISRLPLLDVDRYYCKLGERGEYFRCDCR